MEAGFSLKESTIGIFGLGLMGGSLAMSLKEHCRTLIGFDSHLPTLELALSKKVIDHAESDNAAFLPQVDLLILATPVHTIINIIQHLPSLMPNPCIVLDLGSTKQNIVQAMAALPERFDPIGGHPICGKETLGFKHAESALFQDQTFILTPLDRTSETALSAALKIVEVIGAVPVFLEAELHDAAFAFTSHLPYLLSSALAASLPTSDFPFIGSGFRSVSRLAGTPASMMLSVLQSNQENVLNALQSVQKILAEFESALALKDYSKLEIILNEAQSKYQIITQ